MSRRQSACWPKASRIFPSGNSTACDWWMLLSRDSALPPLVRKSASLRSSFRYSSRNPAPRLAVVGGDSGVEDVAVGEEIFAAPFALRAVQSGLSVVV